MTDEQLSELEALAARATSGPWRVDGMDMFLFGPTNEMIVSEGISGEEDGNVVVRGVARRLPMADNAAFIAASRTAVPDLIAEVRRLRKAIAKGRHDPRCAAHWDNPELAGEPLPGTCNCWKAGL